MGRILVSNILVDLWLICLLAMQWKLMGCIAQWCSYDHKAFRALNPYTLFLLSCGNFQFKKKKNFFNAYLLLRDREKESMSMGGPERGGDTVFEAGSRLWAVSTERDAGLQLMNHEVMTWADVACLTDWATQVTHFQILKKCILLVSSCLFFFNVYFFILRECALACMNKWGRGRERGRENPKQAACCLHRTWHSAQSHELWDHDLSRNQESDV